MPASKNGNYSIENIDFSIFGRSFAHPVRATILSLIRDNDELTNQELCLLLKLDKSTIHCHLKKIRDAGLITAHYQRKSFILCKTKKFQLLEELWRKSAEMIAEE